MLVGAAWNICVRAGAIQSCSEGQNPILAQGKNDRADSVSPVLTLEQKCAEVWCVEIRAYHSCGTVARIKICGIFLWLVLVIGQSCASFSCFAFYFSEKCASLWLCAVHPNNFSIHLHIACKHEFKPTFLAYTHSDKRYRPRAISAAAISRFLCIPAVLANKSCLGRSSQLYKQLTGLLNLFQISLNLFLCVLLLTST